MSGFHPAMAKAEAVIAEFYQAAEPAAGWMQAMQALTTALGGVQAGLQLCDPVLHGTTRMLAMPGVSDTEGAKYLAYFHARDPFSHLGRALQVGEVAISGERIADSALQESEYWRDFAAHHGRGFHLIGMKLGMVGDELAMSGVLRPKEAGAFTEQDRQRMLAVVPHIQRSLSLWHRLGRAAADASLATLMRDALGACLICDGQGRLLLVSPAAERLAGPAGLRLTGGRLAFDRTAIGAAVLALIGQTAEGGPGGTQLLMPGPLGAILAHIGRLPRADGLARPHPVLVELREVTPQPPSAASLRAVFGLGEAEAEVARLLASGQELEAVAMARGTSFNTVRSQVRAVLTKTGTASLRELVALLLAIGRPRGG